MVSLEIDSVRGSYTFSAMKDVVRAKRTIKDIGREISLGNLQGQEVKDIFSQAEELVHKMYEAHKRWIDRKQAKILPYIISGNYTADKPGIDKKSTALQQVNDAFHEGLRTTLFHEHRISKKKREYPSERIRTTQGLERIIVAYTFDFYRTLRVCQRGGIESFTALKIAKMSYIHNPNILTRINADPRFSSIRLGIKKEAIFSSRNPERILLQHKDKVDSLHTIPRFSLINPGDIDQTAWSYKFENAVKHLDQSIATEGQLTGRYPSVRPGVLKRLTYHNSRDPDRAVNRYTTEGPRIKAERKYSSLTDGAIDEYASTSANTDDSLDGYEARRARIDINPEYTSVKPYIKDRAARYYRKPGKAEKYLDGYKKRFARYNAARRYDLYPRSVIERAAIFHIKHTKEYLEKQSYKKLENKKVKPTVRSTKKSEHKPTGGRLERISKITVQYTTVPLNIIATKEFNHLTAGFKYKGTDPDILAEAASHHPDNEHAFIRLCKRNIVRLENDPWYSHFNQNARKEAAIHHPYDPEGFLDSIEETARVKTPQNKQFVKMSLPEEI